MSELHPGIPAYGQDGLAVRDLFFAGSGGVHFFVEDEGQENLYGLLMRRCFPEVGVIEIFPQGGKAGVIAHAEAGHRGFRGVRRIYILDRDFDGLLSEMREDLEGLFYLSQYSVENLVFGEQALVEVCVQESPKESRRELSDKLDFSGAMACWMPHLDRLHRSFYLVQKFCLGIKNTKSPLDDYVFRESREIFDVDKIDCYVRNVGGLLIALGVIGGQTELDDLLEGVFPEISPKFINGKYFFGLAYHHMKRRRLVRNVTTDSLLYRCASTCNLEGFSDFVDAVNIYMATERRSVERLCSVE